MIPYMTITVRILSVQIMNTNNLNQGENEVSKRMLKSQFTLGNQRKHYWRREMFCYICSKSYEKDWGLTLRRRLHELKKKTFLGKLLHEYDDRIIPSTIRDIEIAGATNLTCLKVLTRTFFVSKQHWTSNLLRRNIQADKRYVAWFLRWRHGDNSTQWD